MARRPHAHVGERRETPRARQAFADYAALPPGERSLTKLVEKYRTATESPPTRSLERLKFWSQVWGWQARLAVRDAEIEAAKRQEQIRQAEAQVCENNRLMQQVGQGSLALAACALNAMVDNTTGELKRPVEPRDLPQLMRAGGELLALATGAPTQIIGSGDATQLERCLRESDPETRQAVINGLRAALCWQERHKQGGGA